MPEGWLYAKFGDSVEDEGFFVLYVTSLYWSVTTVTTIGYGDMSPIARGEIGFVICYMVVAGFVFAFVMGQMGDIIQDFYQQNRAQEDAMRGLKQYMDERGIEADLQNLATKYVAYMFLT